MKSKYVFALLAGAMLSATGAFSQIASAQVVAHPQLPGATGRILVRNVQPSLMAWWLDPTHQATPILIQNARQNAKLFPAMADPTGLPLGVKVPALPAGVERIVAIDPQSTLLVFSTEASFKELQKTVALLDKPLRQIEVEAQFVSVEAKDMAALPIAFGAAQADQPDIGATHGRFQSALRALIDQNKAKVITAPRVITISDIPGSLRSTTTTPIVMAYKDETGKLQELFDPIQEKQKVVFLSTAIGLSVVPTLNADETMTLLIAPWKPVQLLDVNQKELLDLSNLDLSRTLSHVRDGETMVFKGLDSRIFGPRDPKNAPANVIVLITARIVRRADDANVETVALQR